MLKNTLKIALRNSLRNKAFSIINIMGLSLGLAGVILILLWVWDEINYDKSYTNASNIFLLINNNTDDEGNSIDYAESPSPMAGYLVSNFPEIKETARVEYFYSGGLIQKGKEFYNEKGAAVDKPFLDIFDISFKHGSKNVFDNPESIIISEKLAKKYFGNDNPIGEVLKVKGYGEEYKSVLVKGVFENFPENSSIRFDFMVPFSLEEKYYSDNWHIAMYATFALLKENCNLEQVNQRIAGIYKDVINDSHFSSYLFPIKNLHMQSPLAIFNNNGQGNIRLIYLMVLIAFIILLVACINYINLTTAKSIKKQKEVSIKKILGASRRYLAYEFLAETLLFSIISFHLAIVIVELLRPTFNNIIGKSININYLNPALVLMAIMIIGFISLTSAIYPYLFLKSYKPVLFLRKVIITNTKKAFAKKALIAAQFVVSFVLIIFSSFIIKQLNFIYSKGLGFDKDNIMVVNLKSLAGKEEVFKNIILKNPDVLSASIGKTPFSSGWPDSWRWEGKSSESRLDVVKLEADTNYLNTINGTLLDGRFFKKGFQDRNSVVINKKFAEIIGKDDILGKKVFFRDNQFVVIGVIDNFYSHHFSEKIKPVAIFNEPTHKFLIRVRNGKMDSVASYIESEFKKIVHGQPFDYTTLQGQLDFVYKKEIRTGKLVGYFSVLAIFISCLGLYGMSVFSAEQRVKEIGIRKALGASTGKIIIMLNLDYIKILISSFVIASPIAIYIVNEWLQEFVYKAKLSVWLFILVGTSAIILAIITVSWQIYRVSIKNPVESLRYE